MFNRKLKKRVASLETQLKLMNFNLEKISFELNNKPQFKYGDTIGDIKIRSNAGFSGEQYIYIVDKPNCDILIHCTEKELLIEKIKFEQAKDKKANSNLLTDLTCLAVISSIATCFIGEKDKKDKTIDDTCKSCKDEEKRQRKEAKHGKRDKNEK